MDYIPAGTRLGKISTVAKREVRLHQVVEYENGSK
jgi:hypothetical protein